MAPRTLGVLALSLASLGAALPAVAQGPRGRPAAECGPQARPVVLRVEPGPAGYVILGRCFGQDRAALRVYEGTAAVPTALVASMSDRRIEVRSKPQGIVQHKVGIGGVESNPVTATHCRCNEHGACDARGVCACQAGWTGTACDTPSPR